MKNLCQNVAMNYADIKLTLTKNIDDKFQAFEAKGIPTERPILGVRVPIIREIARSVPRENVKKILEEKPISMEEVMLRGILISCLNYDEMLEYFDSEVAEIVDWCSCDIFCSSLKPLIKKHRQEFFEQKIDPLLQGKGEFGVRVGLVLLLGSYVTEDYLAVIFDRVESLRNREEYYIKMAIAWLIAECFIKYEEETLSYLKVSHLPKWTFNKAISKICDSLRVEPDVKNYLRTLRRK